MEITAIKRDTIIAGDTVARGVLQPICAMLEGEPLPICAMVTLDPNKPGFGVELKRELLAPYNH